MRFEWDEKKREKVLAEHGVDFRELHRIYQFPTIPDFDWRHSATEDRWRVLGLLDGEVVMVVYTERGDSVLFITARRAAPEEVRLYFATFFSDPF